MTAQTEALSERLFTGLIAGLEMMTVEIGRRLGLYTALHDAGSATSGELAVAAGVDERYAREWLEQQTAAGFVALAEPGDAAGRRYSIPPEHVPVLLDERSPFHLMGAPMALEGVALALPAVVRAFRDGSGVPYEDFGPEIRGGIAALNRPVFAHELAGWIAALPDIAARLRDGGRVLDAGCGVGWSTLELARALPGVRIVGVDLDEASIEEARANAAEAGVGDQVEFLHGDAADPDVVGSDGYTLVTVFEALHDMGEPIEALRGFRRVLAADGAVLVADERVADDFAVPVSDVERLNYAFSVTHCLPATMAESRSIANGTVLRNPVLRSWAEQAGFRATELPIDNEMWRFHRLDAAA